MNQDQTYNLIQKLIVLAAGGLIAKGIGDSSTWEGVGGALAGLITWFISHKWNATPSVPTDPPKTPPMSMGGALHLVLVASLCLFLVGCTTAANSLFTIEKVTTGAVDTYDTLVIQGKVPTNDVPRISQAYNTFHASFLIAVDAAQYNTNAIAPPNLIVESQDIVNLINTITGKAK